MDASMGQIVKTWIYTFSVERGFLALEAELRGRARLRLLDAAGSRSRGRLCCVLVVAAARILRVQPEVTRSFAAGPFPRGGGDSRRDRDARRLARRGSPARPVVVGEAAAPNALESKFAGLVGRGVVSFGEIEANGELGERSPLSAACQHLHCVGGPRVPRGCPEFSALLRGVLPRSAPGFEDICPTRPGRLKRLVACVDTYGCASKPGADR
jgi:hypothetical protein